MSRKNVTLRLRRAATYYFVDKNFAVYDEVGLKSSKRYSKLRADILAVDTKGYINIVEIKSCWNDYISDTKWKSYLPFCNKLYFLITSDLFDSKHGQYIKESLKEHGVGLMVISAEGSVRVVSNASKRKVAGSVRRWLITKLAWRGGFSKATIDRSMRFDVSDKPTEQMKLSLIQFLGLCKADRSCYISTNKNCGYKKYLNYPMLNTDPH